MKFHFSLLYYNKLGRFPKLPQLDLTLAIGNSPLCNDYIAEPAVASFPGFTSSFSSLAVQESDGKLEGKPGFEAKPAAVASLAVCERDLSCVIISHSLLHSASEESYLEFGISHALH